MSWLFSQALVEEFLPESCSDGEPSAPLSGSPTPQAFLPSDRMTAFSRISRFGMTFRPLTADLGEAVLTSYLAAFPARTSALPAKAQESPESAAECGDTWRGSLARLDPDTSSWKTVQHSLLEDSESSSVTWPRSGMTANGQCWELPMSARPIKETGSGLWQTPVADDAVNRVNGKINSRGEPKLSAQVLRWPTPTVCGNYNRKGASPSSGDGLATAVQRWPTPSTIGINGGSHSRQAALKLGATSAELNGGSLNPTWVEWLMGWPLGWTDLKPLATGRCHSVPQQLGKF
jgi:hypothetical protein